MKIARLAGLMFVAVMAIGLVMAAAAMAEPEFRSAGGFPDSGTGTSGTFLLNGVAGSGNTIECKKDTATGTVTNSTLIGNIVVHFLECEGKEGTGAKCPVMSSGAPTVNLIQTTTLHAVLGLALLSDGGKAAGLLVLPVSGNRFTTLLSAPTNCILETAVTGTVAGGVSPVGVLTTTGKLTFVPNSVKGFHLTTGGFVTPKLIAFGGNEATVSTTEERTDTTKCEVT